jgi:hypothetical protein
MSVYAVASTGFVFRECGIFNTTTTAVAARMVRLTTAGTQGSALTAAEYDSNSPVALCTPFGTHTGAPTIGDDLGMRDACGGAVGAGAKFAAAGRGIAVPPGTANGVGVICATGTSQVVDTFLVWDE